LVEIDSKSQKNEPLDIVKSMADVIHVYINSLESFEQKKATENKKPGFFARFFNKNKSSEEKPRSESRERLVIPNELKITLQQMTEQLASVDNCQKTASELTNKITRLKSLEELRSILELMADTFVDFSGQEHQQFESFLQSLTKRIDKVSDFIDTTFSYSEKVKKQSIELDENIQESVSLIKLDFDRTTSLPEIKQNLYQKLDLIITRVNDFQEDQQKDQVDLKRNLDQLKDQLSATEDETARLKEQLEAQKLKAQTDSLTQLPNRYSYNERLTQEYNRWRRYRSPLSLVIGDIDFFKKINDKYGHTSGDQVLKKIAKFLQSELRESDFVARYGGEEFVILLPETTLIDATK